VSPANVLAFLVLFGASLAGCSPTVADSTGSPIPDDGISANTDETITTVVTVSWWADERVTAWVEYGLTEDYGSQTPQQEVGPGEASITVLGLQAGVTYHFRVVTLADGQTTSSDDHAVETGDVPNDMADVDVSDSDESGFGPGWLLSSMVLDMADPERPGNAFILDDAGNVVWYWAPMWGHVNAARLSKDGTAVFVLQEGADTQISQSAIVRVSLDGHTEESILTPWAHHDFLDSPIPGVRLTYIAAEVRTWEGIPVVGDRVVELLQDGSLREVWNAFDNLEITENDGWNAPHYYSFGADWTHANGLAYDQEDDSYLLSLYRIRTIVKIDRATGKTVWFMGGAESDFTFPNDAGFGPQHSPVITSDGILLFDNAYDSGTWESRLVSYTLDDGARTATRNWSWYSPQGIFCLVLGSVARYEDGAVLSSWGESGNMFATDATGALTWEASLAKGQVVGHVSRFPSMY
jgi:hypothetical protein